MNVFIERAQSARSIGCAFEHNFKPVTDEHSVDGEHRYVCKDCGFRIVRAAKSKLESYDWVNSKV